MLEEMDLEGVGSSPGATPQPSMVWGRGAHSQGARAHAGEAEQDGNDSGDDEGTDQHMYPRSLLYCNQQSFPLSFPVFASLIVKSLML